MDPLFLLAQAPPSAPINEWWVPIVSMILVALWDILKRKFNLVEPITPIPTPPVVVPPETPVVVVPPAPTPSPTPILDVVKQLLPLLIPAITVAVTEALKPKQEPTK